MRAAGVHSSSAPVVAVSTPSGSTIARYGAARVARSTRDGSVAIAAIWSLSWGYYRVIVTRGGPAVCRAKLTSACRVAGAARHTTGTWGTGVSVVHPGQHAGFWQRRWASSDGMRSNAYQASISARGAAG